MGRAFDTVISAVHSCIHAATSKPSKTLTVSGMRKGLESSATPSWLSTVLKIALNRRKFGSCESPDHLVFTAVQLHNHLKQTLGGDLLFEDSTCLALFLSGECTVSDSRDLLRQLESGVFYDENGEDSEEDEDSFVVDSDGTVSCEGSSEEEEAVETPPYSPTGSEENGNKKRKVASL